MFDTKTWIAVFDTWIAVFDTWIAVFDTCIAVFDTKTWKCMYVCIASIDKQHHVLLLS